MEGFLRIGLLIIAGVIVFLMMFESRSRRRSRMIEPASEAKFTTDAAQTEPALIESHSLSAAEPVVTKTLAHEAVRIQKPVQNEPVTSKSANDLIVMSVIAKPNQRFASYELLQALSASGMQFGEMNIFHYYLPTISGKITLFSLASATEPGEFDMDHIGDFSCSGLTLFLSLSRVPDPEYAFEVMLQTAEQLAEDLDGELRAGQKHPWNNDVLTQFRNKVSQFVIPA